MFRMISFLLTLALGIMIAPTVWSIARRYNPRATPSYVMHAAAACVVAEIQHLSASAAPQAGSARASSPQTR